MLKFKRLQPSVKEKSTVFAKIMCWHAQNYIHVHVKYVVKIQMAKKNIHVHVTQHTKLSNSLQPP